MFNGFQKIVVMAAIGFVAFGQASHADPNVYDYAVPTTIHTIVAKAKTISADFDELKKIGTDYANGYRIKEATYTFTAPDRLEYKTSVGVFTVTYTTTNTERIVKSNVFHLGSTMDISKDITKRNTIAALGLLPRNYLDTMRIQYLGQDTINGVATQDFMMRYLTDQPNDNRRFEFWIDPIRHYIVQKRVWGGDALQHETIEYKDPQEILPGFWMPTRAEAYTPDMQLAGVVGYDSISAS